MQIEKCIKYTFNIYFFLSIRKKQKAIIKKVIATSDKIYTLIQNNNIKHISFKSIKNAFSYETSF